MEVYNSFADTMCKPKLLKIRDNFFGIYFDLMKAVPAANIIRNGIANGSITEDTTVIETSSGTFALGMALVCCNYGLRCVIVSDPVIDPNLYRRLRDLGCEVDIVDKPLPSGGYQTARLERLHQYMNSGNDYFWCRQYDNEENPLAYADVAQEIVESVGEIDWLVGPTGSGGSMSGLLRGMQKFNAKPVHGVAVDTPFSVLFGQPDGHRDLRGLGNSIIPRNLCHELFEDVHWVTARLAFRNTRRLHQEHGIFAGPTSGASFTAAEWYAAVHPEAVVAAVFPDSGFRYLETVYNDAWLAENGFVCEGTVPRAPVSVGHPTEALYNEWSFMTWGHLSLDDLRKVG